ncbi:hypothetical protein FQR65_LT10833 [Abscondita terminalis]|nr:hypothetical protein FQR65_LT10833 [Abscondita terminalis]
MDEKNSKGNFCETKIGNKGNTNNGSAENISKLKVKTKNGLVNGVRDDKIRCNTKKSKAGLATNIKEIKKNKKDNYLDSQNNCIDIENTNEDLKSTGKICSITEAYIDTINSEHRKELNNESSQTKTNQSKIKSVSEQFDSKKSKSKTKKSEQKDLPKFDLTSLMTSTGTNDNISEMPSTSKITSPFNQPLLDSQDTSDFEKNLIESIKHMKIQQESSVLNHSEEISEKTASLEEAITQSEIELPVVTYVQYESELQMPMIMRIIQKDLSEPYSIYTYRYFIHNWPKLCFLAMCEEKCVGAIVCKLDFHRKSTKRGYIAMLAVDKDYRKRSIGSTLVRRAITEMIDGGADEVVLETEVTNKPALRLYEQLGFVRDKRLFRYYLNGVDALRLKLWLR